MPLFGKKKQAPAAKDSIAKLRETLDMLEKREQFLQKKADQQTVEAKKFMQAKNKRAALMCLKRKKTYEAQMEKIGGARATIEQQMLTLEGANVSLEAMNAMTQAAAAMEAIHRNINVNTVDDTMDKIRDQMDIANDIGNAISTPLGGEVYDDDELLGELEELEQESLDEQLLEVQPTSSQKLPSVPTGKIQSSSSSKSKVTVDEDAELAALEASMA